MNLHEVYLAAQIAAKDVVKGGSSSKPIDTQVNGESENAVQNKAIYDFVNSSVANNTAYFKGTYNSVAELETIVDATNNDYAFVVSTDIYGNTVYNRYKYNGNEWSFEYALNNSSFTANQWNTINSGITSADIQNLQDGKVDKVAGKGLSTNDFTTAEKEKLAALENYDDTDVKADIAKTAEQTALNRSTLGYQRKNLLKNTATSQTKDGIMFTVNEDDSVTVNGTASKNTFFEYFTADVKAKQKLTLSGCPTGGVVNSTYRLYVAVSNASDLGTGLTFTRNNDETLKIGIEVYAGYTAKNLTFTPMLRPAEITDATYEPYKPSVEERLAALESAVFTAQSMKINNTDTNEEKTI